MFPGHGPKKAVDKFQWPMVQMECLKLHLKRERSDVPRKLNNYHRMALTAHEED